MLRSSLSWCALLVALSGCIDLDTQVTLVNASSVDFDEVALHAAGREAWRGPLASGAERTVDATPKRDGSFVVEVRRVDGTVTSSGPYGYTTPGDGQRHRIALRDDGSAELLAAP